MSSYQTRTSSKALSQPNYRKLAGVDSETPKPRRTAEEIRLARQEAEEKRKLVEEAQVAEDATKRALIQRIAELENQLAREDVAMDSPRHTPTNGVLVEHKAPTKVPKKARVHRGDVDAAREALAKAPAKRSHGHVQAASLPRGKENRPPGPEAALQVRKRKTASDGADAGQSAIKKSKPAHPSGVRKTWSGPATSSPKTVLSTPVPSAPTGILVSVSADDGEDIGEDEESPEVQTGTRHTSQGIVSVVHGVNSDGAALHTSARATAAVQRSNGSRKFTNDDLPIPRARLSQWRDILIPRYLQAIGDFGGNPWNLTGLNLVGILQDLWDEIFPEHPVMVAPREAVFCLAQQKIYEWRTNIARAGLEAVEAFMLDEFMFRTADERGEYVRYALGPGLPFRYKVIEQGREAGERLSGPYQSPYLLRTLGTHYMASRKTALSMVYPYAALALCVVAVERALRRWESGTFSSDGLLKFSHDNYSMATTHHLSAIINLKERTWTDITVEADTYAYCTDLALPGSAGDDGNQENAEDERMAIVEDSDEDEE
ncbi:hypothetical protein CERSUDRAFT_115431 [Gelatoporia subvermispora B]|uniref:DUF6532 domain-containing protein n=1 Tax=Ceriporiopsis subvermispora (strain B) TaxID=914234 RepID=M2RDC1_CERS8|nr:hypothetical protein CERSUDRAFT_115431 [Gelatoporia subvermispora B]